MNTGAPQGCVMSPVLFILYTNNLSWNSNNVCMIKYADDTVILGMIENDDNTEYLSCIEFANNWCEANFLDLNVQKTKEVIWDFRTNSVMKDAVRINGMEVEITSMYKYLGLILDNQLSFKDHVESQLKKSRKRMYCIRCLKNIRVEPEIIAHFYNATIPPTLMYASSSFYGLLTKYLNNDLNRPHTICHRMLGSVSNLVCNDEVYERKMKSLTSKILKCDDHPLSSYFVLMPSGRRYRFPSVRTNRFKFSFVPCAIRLLND